MKEKRMVEITGHARDQARQRFGIADSGAVDALIRRDVASGQLLKHKPKPFRLYHERGRELLGNQRFVASSNGERGYIIDIFGDKHVVITSLLRTR